MKKASNIIIVLLVLAIIALAVFVFVNRANHNIGHETNEVSKFAACSLKPGAIVAVNGKTKSCSDGTDLFIDLTRKLPTENPLITVESPKAGAKLSNPLKITGQARGQWFFEASFPVAFADEQGKIVGQGLATAKEEWMTEKFVPFEASIVVENYLGKGYLIMSRDNPSGLPENEDAIYLPVEIVAPKTGVAEQMTVNVFFSNNKIDKDTMYCEKTYATPRLIPKTPAVARAALEQLLLGPTAAEKKAGFLTSINDKVKIQKLTVENGVAKVDFNKQLEYKVGGSCRVAAIASQIRETLMQFSSVKSVVISIDGRTEDILQP